MNTSALIVYVYAALVSVGGLLGYVKAKSLPSLIAGEAGFLALVAAGYGVGHGRSWGLPLALALIPRPARLLRRPLRPHPRVHGPAA